MFERVYPRSTRRWPMPSEGTIASLAIHVVAGVALVIAGASPAFVAQQVTEGIIFLAPPPSPIVGPTTVSEPLRFVEHTSMVAPMAIDDAELHVDRTVSDRPPQAEVVTIAAPVDSVAAVFERPADSVYFAEQVDSPAAYDQRSAAPAYPDSLQRAGIEGSVSAQFVIDTTGHVEMATVRVLESTNRRFSESVMAALPRMLFRPAVLNGRKARQIVEVPFKFRVVSSRDTARTRDTAWARPPAP